MTVSIPGGGDAAPRDGMLLHENARFELRSGIRELARAVAVTYGPRGKNVALGRAGERPLVTRDGLTVAREVELQDPVRNTGVTLARRAAVRTSEEVGDGTTTAILLTEAMFDEAVKYVTAGAAPRAVRLGVDRAVERAMGKLRKLARPVEGLEGVARGAAVSCGDAVLGDLVARAVAKGGPDGTVTVEPGTGLETELEVVRGARVDGGWLSSRFMTAPQEGEAVLEDTLVLLHDGRIEDTRALTSLLKEVAEDGRPLLLVAEGVEPEPLSMLVVNHARGTLRACAAKSPAFGGARRDLLEDLAVLTGATVISASAGRSLGGASLKDLGSARRVVVTASQTTIVDGGGDPGAIRERAATLRGHLDEGDAGPAEGLERRLAGLAGGVSVLRIGGATETEMEERAARVRDAVRSVGAARAEGVVPGGGVAFVRAAAALTPPEGTSRDEALGWKVVREALDAPLRRIAENAGAEGLVVVQRVREADGTAFGFDAEREAFGDLVEAGVVDAALVLRTALLSAASVAGALLTSDGVLHLEEGAERSTAPTSRPGAGMGGMSGVGRMGGAPGLPGLGGGRG